MIIIDIARPNTRFIDDYNTTLIRKSLNDINYEKWMEIKKIAANST